MTLTPQPLRVPTSLSNVPPWWNWRLSAQFRQASLVSTAFMVFFPALLGPLFFPFAVLRGSAGLTQTLLNRNLSLVSPLGSRSAIDWLFFMGFMASGLAAYWAPVESFSVLGAEMLLFPALVCYAVIQWRAVGLSRQAEERDVRAEQRALRRIRLDWASGAIAAEPERLRLAA